jgi:hypothetical protein
LLEAEITQVKTADDGGCSLVSGSVVIYKEESGTEATLNWAVFKRNGGDPFLFRNMFENVVRHAQIKEDLPKENA